MNRILFIAYCAGILFALTFAIANSDVWVAGLVLAVYALTHLLLRHIDQKEPNQ